MKLYRLYTEDKNRAGIRRILDQYFRAYTLLAAEGTWETVPEKSLIVEVIGTERDGAFLALAGGLIKHENAQQTVKFVELDVKTFDI